MREKRHNFKHSSAFLVKSSMKLRTELLKQYLILMSFKELEEIQYMSKAMSDKFNKTDLPSKDWKDEYGMTMLVNMWYVASVDMLIC